MKNKKHPTRTRYTDAQKKKITQFIHDYNEKHGIGGVKAAIAKYGINYMTAIRWGIKSDPRTTKAILAKPRKAVGSSRSTNINPALLKRIDKTSAKLWKLINQLK